MMFLAKIVDGRAPVITEVCGIEWAFSDGQVVRRPRQAWARKIANGAAALSQTPAGAIASAKVVLEQEILKQKGRTMTPGPKPNARRFEHHLNDDHTPRRT